MISSQHIQRKPSWLRTTIPSGEVYKELKDIKHQYRLVTVCEEARCPNHGECWARKHVTFMILGNHCTRSCLFCSVQKGKPEPVDETEPGRVAEAIRDLGVRYAVITSVTRDDLEDGGVGIFVKTVEEIRRRNSAVRIELLIPDLMGREKDLKRILDSGADVVGHNLETSERVHGKARSSSDYRRSLRVLADLRRNSSGTKIKSAFLVGLGETEEEIFQMITDLAESGVEILCMGQYLMPSIGSLPVERYVSAEEFKVYESFARSRGISKVFAGTLVRSSYHAGEVFESSENHEEKNLL